MANQIIDFYLPFFLAIAAISMSLYQWRRMDLPGKILSVGLMISIVIDSLHFFYPAHNMINSVLLHAYNLTDFMLTCFFFYYAVPRFRKKNHLVYLGVAGFLFWLACLIFFRNMRWAASIRFESFSLLCAITLSLISLYYMIIETEWQNLVKNPVFWLIFCTLFYDSITFIFTIMFEILARNAALFWKLEKYEMVITCAYYALLVRAFSLYSKQTPAGA
jgi:hypothetical protein